MTAKTFCACATLATRRGWSARRVRTGRQAEKNGNGTCVKRPPGEPNIKVKHTHTRTYVNVDLYVCIYEYALPLSTDVHLWHICMCPAHTSLPSLKLIKMRYNLNCKLISNFELKPKPKPIRNDSGGSDVRRRGSIRRIHWRWSIVKVCGCAKL